MSGRKFPHPPPAGLVKPPPPPAPPHNKHAAAYLDAADDRAYVAEMNELAFHSSRYWERQWAIESERANRATSQIREALAIMESGSDYEKLHLRGILEAGL